MLVSHKMKEAQTSGQDLVRNRNVYDTFWSSRWRRSLTYANTTKLRRFRRELPRRTQGLASPLRVFEQGFGMGMMLMSFPRSTHITGLELSPVAVQSATDALSAKGFTKIDLRTFEAGAGYPADWEGQADFAISSHVLEHLEDPAAGLGPLVQMLRPGGRACIVVPINEKPDEDLNHFHRFTPETIQQAVRQNGLVVTEAVECDRLWPLMAPVARRLQDGGGVALKIYSKCLNGVLACLPAWALSLADSLLGGFGVRNCQIFLWCEKPASGSAAHR